MRVTGRFEFLSSKEGASRAGKPYFILNLLQNDDVTKIYIDNEKYCRMKDIPKMTELDVCIDVRQSADRVYIDLLDHKIIGNK